MNPNQYADFIWNIKEYLRDDYAEKEYEDVILPFTLLRRIDCVLEKTDDAVIKTLEKYRTASQSTLDALLKKAAGCNFYNTSPFTLTTLLDDNNALDENFNSYLNGFSENIKDILYNFSGGREKGLSPIYQTLLRKNLLFQIIREFTKIDLHPEVIDNHNMGTIFEVLIRKSKETSNEKAGQYYTPREIVRLMVNVVFANQSERLTQSGGGCTIYDPACGTGGMLTVAKEHLLSSVNPKLDVYLFGQELKEQTYAICKADILIKGENADNIKQGNTISHDELKGKLFHYMLTNPPFGDDWKKIADVVEEEEAMGSLGRFSAGTPDKSDGSLLFLQHMISKMEPSGSVIGIVFNGSPLFNGDAGSGPSNIRRWIIENDWLDCIIALPKDLFYGTGISTYIWIITNKKPEQRKGKVFLINAVSNEFFTPLSRSLGKKMVEISDEQIKKITELYTNYVEVEKLTKIFNNQEFGYTKVTVERPLRLKYIITDNQIEDFKLSKPFTDLAASNKKDKAKAEAEIESGKQKQAELLKVIKSIQADSKEFSDTEFMQLINKKLSFKLSKGWLKNLRGAFGIKDEDAQKVLQDPLAKNIPATQIMDREPAKWYEIDTDLRDTESIPLKQDIDEYFKREVLPYAPDAWMDREKDKIGYTISFTKYFYEYKPLRELEDIMAEFKALDDETEDLIKHIEE